MDRNGLDFNHWQNLSIDWLDAAAEDLGVDDIYLMSLGILDSGDLHSRFVFSSEHDDSLNQMAYSYGFDREDAQSGDLRFLDQDVSDDSLDFLWLSDLHLVVWDELDIAVAVGLDCGGDAFDFLHSNWFDVLDEDLVGWLLFGDFDFSGDLVSRSHGQFVGQNESFIDDCTWDDSWAAIEGSWVITDNSILNVDNFNAVDSCKVKSGLGLNSSGIDDSCDSLGNLGWWAGDEWDDVGGFVAEEIGLLDNTIFNVYDLEAGSWGLVCGLDCFDDLALDGRDEFLNYADDCSVFLAGGDKGSGVISEDSLLVVMVDGLSNSKFLNLLLDFAVVNNLGLICLLAVTVHDSWVWVFGLEHCGHNDWSCEFFHLH